MPGHRKTAAATRLTANRSLSAPPARVSITKRNRNSSRTARTRPRRGLHDVTASQSLHAAIPQKRLITERQCGCPRGVTCCVSATHEQRTQADDGCDPGWAEFADAFRPALLR